jgi:hypothetical protein
MDLQLHLDNLVNYNGANELLVLAAPAKGALPAFCSIGELVAHG